MAKTFYKLTPKAKKIARKMDKFAQLVEDEADDVENVLDINTANLKQLFDGSDVLYLFQQYGDMEFCDRDFHKDRNINYYKLEQNGLLKETLNDPD